MLRMRVRRFAGVGYIITSLGMLLTQMIDGKRLQLDLLGIGLLAGLAFLLLSLLSWSPADAPSVAVFPANETPANWCGPTGARVAAVLVTIFGFGSWIVVGGLAVLDWRLLTRRSFKDPALCVAGVICFVVAGCLLLQMFAPTFMAAHPVGSGGYVGGIGTLVLSQHFSVVGSMILVGTLIAIGILLSFDGGLMAQSSSAFLKLGRVATWPVRRVFGISLFSPTSDRRKRPRVGSHGLNDVTRPVSRSREKSRRAETVRHPDDVDLEDEYADEDFRDGVIADAESLDAASPETELVIPDDAAANRKGKKKKTAFKVNRPATVQPKSLGFEGMGIGYDDEYELPSLDILDDAEPFPFEELAAKAQTAAAVLEKTFEDFGLNVTVAEIDTGPVVTQFELILEPGLRVSKVTGLADDLAVALRVPAVRVVSPIPGKNTVGVEVPNATRVNVRMRELIETSSDKADEMAMPLFLGKDVSGQALTVDMAKMPHLLIAGRTGTGKSVCLNTLICSLLMTRSPDEVKMLMIDPKMVELSPYKSLPHLMHPVITDMKQAEAVLAWAVDKMEERYDLLARCGVRHLESYNQLGRAKALKKMGLTEFDEEASSVPEHMPYIIVIADEMADMMMTCGKDVEAHIVRLAQKSRAVGIHLVLATQKPTVDVITGLIKSNLPARLSFQVASKTDSRVVLDENGAERLLGYGDMLFLAPSTSSLTRAQGTYVSDEEVNDIIDFFSDQPPQYSEELKQVTASGGKTGDGSDGMKNKDPVYLQAIGIVVGEQRGSCSLLQRHLSIGYGKASRYIDFMFEDGIVGEYNGSKHRDVLLDEEAWESLRESLGM